MGMQLKPNAEQQLSIVIVSFNSVELILNGLAEILDNPSFNVVIVDNHGSDHAEEILSSAFPQQAVITMDRNIGYGRAANLGFSKVNTRYILLLNPDISVSSDELISFFNAVLSSKQGAAVYAPTTILDQKTNQGFYETNNVLGAVMLFDMEVMSQIGLFDENIFLYYEEKDLCKRIIDSGNKIVISTDHYFPHAKGTSSGSSGGILYLKQWHVGWSSLYFFKKHNLARGRHRPIIMIIRYFLKSIFSLSESKRRKYRARCGGVIAFLLGKKAFDINGNPRRLDVLSKQV